MSVSPRLTGALTPGVVRSGQPSLVHGWVAVDAPDGPPLPIDLYIAHVEPHTSAVCAALEASVQGLSVTTLTPDGPRAGARLSGRGFGSLNAALRAFLNRPAEDAPPAHLLLVVGGAGLEAPEPLLDAAGAIAERAWGVDVIASHPAVELSLLGQVAAVGRGELMMQERPSEPAFAARLVELSTQAVSGPLLDVTVAPGIEAGRIFRAEPVPVLLGVPRLTDADRRIILDVGPLGRGTRLSWLFDLQVTPRPAGHYRLLDVSLRFRRGQRVGLERLELSLVMADTPWQHREVHAPTADLRDRAELVGECENISGAFHRGDGRRVAVGLSGLIRRLGALGQDTLVERAFALRLAFLRSGSLDRAGFNRLRRAVERI